MTTKPWNTVDLRFIALCALSFGGIVTSVVLARNLTTDDASASEQHAMTAAPVPMLIAASEIPAGTKLSPEMFRIESRSNDGIQDQAVYALNDIEESYSRATIAANTPVLQAVMSKTPLATDIVTRIPDGFRAVAIPVNALTGVEGWVRPGATVDVVWSTTRGDEVAVSTIVENAKVLSVERSLEAQAPSQTGPSPIPNHITLLATTVDAQKIQLAKNSGSLSLSLRGESDAKSSGTGVITSDHLLARYDPRARVNGRVTVDGKEYVLIDNRLVDAREAGMEAQ
jgi:pilus assembly protein CpaB